MTSKDSFKKTLQVMNTGRPVFVPFVYGLAARIEQVTLSDMAMDPTYYANLLEGAYKLLQQDAIITNFDPSLEAEIFGCQVNWQSDFEIPVVTEWSNCELSTVSLNKSSRIPVMLEAIKRLVLTCGKEVGIVGVVNGTCSLAKNIAEHARLDKEYSIEEIISITGSQLTKLTKSICELKVDAVIFREDLLAEQYWPELSSHNKSYSAIYATLFNLTKFYNIAALIMMKEQKMAILEELVKQLKPNGFILSSQKVNVDDLKSLKILSDSQKLAIGLSLPMSDQNELLAQYDLIHDFVKSNQPKGFFYTSDGEVPQDMPLEIIRDLVSRIKGLQES